MRGDFASGLERGQIERVQPGVGAEQLHVQRVVLPPGDHAGFIGIPAVGVGGRPGIFERLFDARPPGAQPLLVAAELPLAVEFDHAAHQAVHAGAERAARPSQRQAQAEHHAAVVVLIVAVVQLAHTALQRGEEEWQREGVVPDVGAAALAGAGVHIAALKGVELAVLQPHTGGRFEQRYVGRDRVERGFGQIRGIERFGKETGFRLQRVPVFERVGRDGARGIELRGIVVLPRFGAGFVVLHGAPVAVAGGIIPAHGKADGARFAGPERYAHAQRGGVAATAPVAPFAVVVLGVDAVFQRAGHGEIVPEQAQIVEPCAAEPVLLADGRVLFVHGHDQLAIARIALGRVVGQAHAGRAALAEEPVEVPAQLRIGQRERGGIVDALVLRVGQRERKERRGQAGIFVVQRDIGVKGVQADAAGEGLVGKVNFGEGERALKFAVAEMGHSAQQLALGAEAVIRAPCGHGRAAGLGHVHIALAHIAGRGVGVEDARVQQLAVFLGLDGKMRIAVDAALVGTVEDFPVDQAAIAVQADTARANAAQREGDFAAKIALIELALHH